MTSVTLKIPGISCTHCEKSIKGAVGILDGVSKVEVDIPGKKVTIEYNPSEIDLDKIKSEIEDQGYDIE